MPCSAMGATEIPGYAQLCVGIRGGGQVAFPLELKFEVDFIDTQTMSITILKPLNRFTLIMIKLKL